MGSSRGSGKPNHRTDNHSREDRHAFPFTLVGHREQDIGLGSDPQSRGDHCRHAPARLKGEAVDRESMLQAPLEAAAILGVIIACRRAETAGENLPEWREPNRRAPYLAHAAEPGEVAIGRLAT